MGGQHGHAASPATRGQRLVAAAVLLPVLVATVVGLVLLWPSDAERVRLPEGLGPPAQLLDAVVLDRGTVPCAGAEAEPDGPVAPTECVRAEVRLEEGPDAGRTVTLESADNARTPFPPVGTGVVVAYAADAEPGTEYYLVDRRRDRPLLLLGVLFGAAVLALGRWRGLLSLAGLGVSLVLLTVFTLPALVAGKPPVPTAVVTASAVMLLVLYLTHGISVRTSVAVGGTLASLVLTALLGTVGVRAAQLTGLVSDETAFLNEVAGGVDLRGLLLAGIIIGALGVLDDVTVTQTSAVWELARADPSAGRATLFAAGMRIGRDHVASAVNTLALAYAGAALPVLVLFTLARSSAVEVVTGELVAQEIVRTLVGGTGLVAAVPITTALAAAVVAGRGPAGGAAGGPAERSADGPPAGPAEGPAGAATGAPAG